jgi:hypothetical protein
LFDSSSNGPSSSWASLAALGVSHLRTNPNYRHPELEESNLLCKLFFDTVNPFLRVLHEAHFGRELDRYRRGRLDWPKDFEALLAAIYLLTINSLCPDVLKTAFSASKDALLAKYQQECQNTFAQVNFYKTDNVHTLQALIHYVVELPLRTSKTATEVNLYLGVFIPGKSVPRR